MELAEEKIDRILSSLYSRIVAGDAWLFYDGIEDVYYVMRRKRYVKKNENLYTGNDFCEALDVLEQAGKDWEDQ
jgi:hypothetical protein